MRESFHDNADVPKIVWLFSLLNAILVQVMNVVWVCCSYIAISRNVKRYYGTKSQGNVKGVFSV